MADCLLSEMVNPSLMVPQATGHRDSSVSKMAVTCIHDFIVAVLAGRHELPHFHINEFLCKTFEDMLCLELCDSDVQDQVRTHGQTWYMLTIVWYILTKHVVRADRHVVHTDKHVVHTDRYVVHTDRYVVHTDKHMVHTDRHVHEVHADKHMLHTERHVVLTDRRVVHPDKFVVHTDKLVTHTDKCTHRQACGTS